MAISPKDEYPSQTLTNDAAYPQGKARNDVVENDGVGTPLEATWVNDIWGFLQAILKDTETVPSGDPDTADASQYLDALKEMFIDARNGGEYEPDAVIEIGGAGVLMSGPFFATGGVAFQDTVFTLTGTGSFSCSVTASFFDPVTFAATAPATFDGDAEFNGDVEFNDGVEFTSDVLFSGNNAFVQADAIFSGTATFNGVSEFNDVATYTANVIFGQGLAVAEGAIWEGVLGFSGDGHIRYRVAELADADASVDVGDGDIFVVTAALTVNRTLTLANTGADDGDVIEVLHYASTIHSLAVENAAAVALDTLATGDSGRYLYRAATGWRKLS